MFADFLFIHADVIRNSVVLLLLTLGTVLVTVLVTWRLVLTKAHREASANLKQRNAELTVENKALREQNERQWKEIERLTHVQDTAVAAARSVQEAAKE